MPSGNPIVLTAVEWLMLISMIGIFIQVIKLLVNRNAKIRDEQIKKNADEIGNIYDRIHNNEKEYSEKLDDVKFCLDTTSKNILEAVNNVRVEIAQNYVTKQDCRYIESQIKP
jgi:hypothetical protein